MSHNKAWSYPIHMKRAAQGSVSICEREVQSVLPLNSPNLCGVFVDSGTTLSADAGPSALKKFTVEARQSFNNATSSMSSRVKFKA